MPALAVASMVAYGVVAHATRIGARRAFPQIVLSASGFSQYSPYFIWVPYLVLGLRPGPEIDLPGPVRALGVALIVAGPLVMIWSARALGRHFDVEVQVHRGHEVVRTGPYRHVRHPIYAGIALHFIGACLATGNVVLTLGTLLVGIPALYLRAAAEERLLRAQLGDAYDRYARDVGMLVPRL